MKGVEGMKEEGEGGGIEGSGVEEGGGRGWWWWSRGIG